MSTGNLEAFPVTNQEKQDENSEALEMLEDSRSERKISEQSRGLLIGNITCLLQLTVRISCVDGEFGEFRGIPNGDPCHPLKLGN